MSTANLSKSAVATAVLLLALAGCDSGVRTQDASPSQASLESALDRYLAKADVLRARADEARGRIWALHPDGVDVYDARSARKLRSIALPEWIWAGLLHSCPPDLVVGAGGEVIVSSNVVPVLWRIDPASFQVSRHELAVVGHPGREVGFSGMTYSPRQGAYLGVNGLDGSLWRIDLALGRTQQIPLSTPVARACEVSAKASTRGSVLSALCVQADDRQWAVHFAPDQRSAYAHPGACTRRDLAPTAQLQTSKVAF